MVAISCAESKSVRGNPIHLIVNAVDNYPQFLLCPGDSGSARQYHGIVKTMPPGLTVLDFMQVFFVFSLIRQTKDFPSVLYLISVVLDFING